jgi:hypothetical protein
MVVVVSEQSVTRPSEQGSGGRVIRIFRERAQAEPRGSPVPAGGSGWGWAPQSNGGPVGRVAPQGADQVEAHRLYAFPG